MNWQWCARHKMISPRRRADQVFPVERLRTVVHPSGRGEPTFFEPMIAAAFNDELIERLARAPFEPFSIRLTLGRTWKVTCLKKFVIRGNKMRPYRSHTWGSIT